MKIKVDSFLNGETSVLKGATSTTPVKGIIRDIILIKAEDLGFPSEDDRYQLDVEIAGDVYQWMPNKTSLKTFVNTFGDDSDNWKDKPISVYLVDQNVAGKMKKVVYSSIA